MKFSTKLLASKPYIFVLGPERKPLYIHSGLFKGISEPLYNRTPEYDCWNSDEDEISDVKWDVFAALAEFAYTGAYSLYISRRIPDTVSSTSSSQDPEDKAIGSARLRSWLEDIPRPSENPPQKRTSVVPDDGSVSRKRQKTGDEPSTSKDSSLEASTTGSQTPMDLQINNALLFHAEVCVAAARYLIEGLEHLSYKKLYWLLTYTTPHPKRIFEIVDLLRYLYTDEGCDAVPKLKKLALNFAARQRKVLVEHERFKSLLKSKMEIAVDLVYEIASCSD